MNLENAIKKSVKGMLPLALTSSLMVSCLQNPVETEQELESLGKDSVVSENNLSYDVNNETVKEPIKANSVFVKEDSLIKLDEFPTLNVAINNMKDTFYLGDTVKFSINGSDDSGLAYYSIWGNSESRGDKYLKGRIIINDPNKFSENNSFRITFNDLIGFDFRIEDNKGNMTSVYKEAIVLPALSKSRRCNPFIRPIEDLESRLWVNYSEEKKIMELKKFLREDRTDKMHFDIDSYVCSDFAHDLEDSFVNDYNIPMYWVGLSDNSVTLGGHAINAVLIGENPLKIEDWLFIEPQSDQFYGYDDERNKLDHWYEGHLVRIRVYDEFKGYHVDLVNFDFKQENPANAVYAHRSLIKERPLQNVNSLKKYGGNTK